MNQDCPPKKPEYKQKQTNYEFVSILLCAISFVFLCIGQVFVIVNIGAILFSIIGFILAYRYFELNKKYMLAFILSVSIFVLGCTSFVKGIKEVFVKKVYTEQRLYRDYYDLYDDVYDFFEDDEYWDLEHF